MLFYYLFFLLLVSCHANDLEQFLKIRCSLNPKDKDTFMEFEGNVYSNIVGKKPKLLFKTLGVNVANCIPLNDSYLLTSRELMFYLDPKTGQKMDTWFNPYINETLNVVHVFNNPVQNTFSNDLSFDFQKDDYSYSIQQKEDVPLFYKNPLYQNETFRPYAPLKHYQAGEFFNFIVSVNDFHDKTLKKIDNVHYSWFRHSQFLPFMKMGTNVTRYKEGFLIFSSNGFRKKSFSNLSNLLQKEIMHHYPIMRHAPTNYIDEPNETSFTYFEKHFEEYLN